MIDLGARLFADEKLLRDLDVIAGNFLSGCLDQNPFVCCFAGN
jgi:hypothetical protein